MIESAGTAPHLLAAGHSVSTARDTFNAQVAILIDSERKQHQYELAVRAIRQDVVDGSISDDDAIGLLGQAGMIESARVGQVATWATLMNHRRAMATTAVILRWYNEFLIDESTALLRLQRIGWSQADALLELGLPAPARSKRQEVESSEYQSTHRHSTATTSRPGIISGDRPS